MVIINRFIVIIIIIIIITNMLSVFILKTTITVKFFNFLIM